MSLKVNEIIDFANVLERIEKMKRRGYFDREYDLRGRRPSYNRSRYYSRENDRRSDQRFERRLRSEDDMNVGTSSEDYLDTSSVPEVSLSPSSSPSPVIPTISLPGTSSPPSPPSASTSTTDTTSPPPSTSTSSSDTNSSETRVTGESLGVPPLRPRARAGTGEGAGKRKENVSLDDIDLEENQKKKKEKEKVKVEERDPLKPRKKRNDTLKFMSYNILWKIFEQEGLSNLRKVLELVEAESPDAVGFQEAADFVHDSKTMKPNYAQKIHLSKKGVGGTVVYTNNKFHRENVTTLNFSNKHGLTKDAHDRPGVGGKYTISGTDKSVYIISLHLDHHMKEDVVLGGIEKMLNSLGYTEGENLVIMGDFNEFYIKHRKGKSYKDLLFKDKYNDVRLVSKRTNGKPFETCCTIDFSFPLVGDVDKPADLIYSNMKVVDAYKISTIKSGESYASDHMPIVAELLPRV